MKTCIIIVAMLALGACHHTTEPSVTITERRTERDPDVPAPLTPVPSTDLDARACARLRELACLEGVEKRCRRTFEHARTNESAANRGDVDAVAACVVKAADVARARACGGPNTLTFECR